MNPSTNQKEQQNDQRSIPRVRRCPVHGSTVSEGIVTYAVYMFAADNEWTYLLGYYTALQGESEDQLLDRVVQQTASAREHLNIR